MAMTKTETLLLNSGPDAGLTPAMYAEILKQLPPPFVSDTTSELQAGFMLGVQYVLTKLQPYVR